MKQIAYVVLSLVFFMSKPGNACKCSKFSSPKEMFDKSEFVFVGNRDLKAGTTNGITFLIERLAKGDQNKIGSDKITIKWQNDENELCRGYKTEMSFLVFAVQNKEGTFSFLSDCYSELITAGGPQYVYKNTKYTDFSFFQINTLSAMNGLRPMYAAAIRSNQAKEMALQHLWENVKFKKTHNQDRDHWKVLTADKKEDSHKQFFWNVTIGYVPKRAKGEFYVVRFYNTLPESFQISPGE